MKHVVDKIAKANDAISEARKALTEALERMLENKTHTFKTYDVYVTDEENCTREQLLSCTKDMVEFLDGTTMDIDDLGTDDLHSVVDMVHSELTEQ